MFWTDCKYPKGFMVWIALHGVMFLFLFADFYKQNYIENQKRKAAAVKRASLNGKLDNNDGNHGAEKVSLTFNPSDTLESNVPKR